MSTRWPFIVSVAFLGATLLLQQTMSHGEQIPTKRPFAEFPMTIAEHWEGRPMKLEPKILDVLQLSDYLLRVYMPQEPRQGPVTLYVGYYQSQRTGASYHSPKNCLPGSGWQFGSMEYLDVPLPQRTITINKAVIEKGTEKEVMFYWYHDRGRIIASEYWAKAYMTFDAMTKNRTDGALVRLTIPVTTSVEDASEQGITFLRDFWPVLQEYMPSEV